MNIVRGLALAALLCAVGASQAQLKPSGPATPPLPPATVDLKKLESQSVKELAARAAAEKWLALLDAGEYGKAWDAGAKLFQERVPRERWVENLPKDRSFGKLKERRSEVASFRTSLPGAPDGEYVTVRFSSNFENKNDAEELMTLVFENGAWRVLGYGIR
jgi:hypothetical protein